MHRSLRRITETAVMLALLVAVQALTKAGGQLLTGSCVNLILAVSACMLGFSGSAVVAVVSPFLAFLLGITPLPNVLIVPGIALGNLVYTAVISLLFRLLRHRLSGTGKLLPYLHTLPAALIGALLKFAVMALVQVQLILPLLGLPEPALAALSVKMGIEQLPTALIGGVIAAIIVPTLKKARKD